MANDLAREARRDALNHAMQVMGAAARMRSAGAGFNERTELLAAQELIAKRGVPGEPGSAEHKAGAEEKAAILEDIRLALADGNKGTDFDPITWAERRVQARLAAVLGL